MTFDVIIVGGSYAGISAGMQLARARRRVLVMDTGLRRNRFARASHGFLGQDGRDPAAIADDARAQLLAYPSVEWLSEAAVAAKKEADGFVVKAANGERFTARRLILASGVADELPEIPGLAERWGRHVFHCPYCHGYELDGGPIGVLAASPLAIHHALMLPDWGATTFFLNGVFEPDAEQMSRLDRRGVTIEREAVVALRRARRRDPGQWPHDYARGVVHPAAYAHGQPAGGVARLRVRGRAERAVHQDRRHARNQRSRRLRLRRRGAGGRQRRHRGGRRRAHRWRGASFAAVPLTPEADRRSGPPPGKSFELPGAPAFHSPACRATAPSAMSASKENAPATPASKNVLVITANTGIERDELLEPLKPLKQQGATVTHATIEGGEAQTWVHDSEKDLIVNSDARLQGLRAEDYDLLLVPGGTVNADTLRQDSEAQRLVREFSDAGKTVAAICHGPWLLIDAGVARGKTLTSYSSVRIDLTNAGADWVDTRVKVCPANGWTLITSRNPGDLQAFNEAIGEACRRPPDRHSRRRPVDTLKIATFNVNGIQTRLAALLAWLGGKRRTSSAWN